MPKRITSPDDPALAELCATLAERAIEMDRSGQWPAEQLRLCGEYGVYEWFIDPAWGGQGWNEEQLVRGYLALSAACVTTSFVLTQRTGACRRIEGCGNETLKQRLMPGLASGAVVRNGWHFAPHDQPASFGQARADRGSDSGRLSTERHVAVGDGRRRGRCDYDRSDARRKRRGDRAATADGRADRYGRAFDRRSAAADRR